VTRSQTRKRAQPDDDIDRDDSDSNILSTSTIAAQQTRADRSPAAKRVQFTLPPGKKARKGANQPQQLTKQKWSTDSESASQRSCER
jgi:hypothetical protein